ncbi:MAG TPA: vitamin K epoxide reductase family protein, partial [Phycisphaerales bacterium]|nr:vitamin K epoxide reductase family protein [Phycisphaerales bacterium]
MSKQNPITTSPAKAHLIPGLVLAAALAASWALALATLGSIQLPGCGPGSSCDKAASSAWGSLPVLGLPISIVGAAWFTASLAAFMITATGDAGRGRTLRALWVLSALSSVLYLGVIIYHGFWCRMCITVHIANITFVAMILRAPPAPAAGKHRQLLAILIAFIVGLGTLLTLGRMHHAHQSAVLAERAAQQERSLQEIAAAPS